ncbi:hypothetical protein HanHA300_Chr11g0424511 [Helianthus annuus]|nr:hypothetical protein HanHA300_Chr11g0424511 [Helianthus annuus]KAJ0519418.1 hypothetical protein HanHA89_Chr11g0448531 [Helianthus annuus]KAJ0691207.1 hypothetical protein HanOQP8_Chr11g0426501 [Helianthus annuus]
MSPSSTSASRLIRKPKLFKVDLDGNVFCYHDIVAVLRVVAGGKSERHGQQFSTALIGLDLIANSSCGKKILITCLKNI